MLDFSTICLLIHFPWCLSLLMFWNENIDLGFLHICLNPIWIPIFHFFCILVNFLVFLQDKELLRKHWEEKEIDAMLSSSRLPFCHHGNLFIVCTDLSLSFESRNQNFLIYVFFLLKENTYLRN